MKDKFQLIFKKIIILKTILKTIYFNFTIMKKKNAFPRKHQLILNKNRMIAFQK